MLFNSFVFVLFLPLVFLLYWFVFSRTVLSRNIFISNSELMDFKLFFRKIMLVFCLPVALFLVGYEVVYRNLDNPYALKHRRMMELSEDVEVLVLGSSHTFFGINPDYLSPVAFNAANV